MVRQCRAYINKREPVLNCTELACETKSDLLTVPIRSENFRFVSQYLTRFLLKMVGRGLTIFVFFLFLVVVSAFHLPTVRKTESQPHEQLYSRAAVERRWVDGERPLSPDKPPPALAPGVSKQKVERRWVDGERPLNPAQPPPALPPGVSKQEVERRWVDGERALGPAQPPPALPPGVPRQKVERRWVEGKRPLSPAQPRPALPPGVYKEQFERRWVEGERPLSSAQPPPALPPGVSKQETTT